MLFTVGVLENEPKSKAKHSRYRADHLRETDVCPLILSFEG